MDKTFIPYLWNAMQEHHNKQPVSAHTPGHKNGLFLPEPLKKFWGNQFASYDFTELPGLDNLHFPQDAIFKSEKQSADIFHAKQCFYLINGTTQGLHAAILTASKNKKIFVPRHVHRSIYNGILLANAEPIYLPVELDQTTSLPLGISPVVLEKYIEQYPDCKNLILVNPTYHGITASNEDCVRIAKLHGLTVIADEAHGSHLHFHDKLPSSLLDSGADMVVQSWHKTLPVLTQASALLVNKNYSGPSPEPFISMLCTTSPSYLLLASLEAGSIYMGEESKGHIDKSLELIFLFHRKISENLKTLSVLWKPDWKQDPFKLYLVSNRLSGFEMDDFLRTHFALYSEMHDTNGILFILPLQTTNDWLDNLFEALTSLDIYCQTKKIRDTSPAFYTETIPKQCMSLEAAIYHKKKEIPICEADGFISGQFILHNPPGIPLVVPGEYISEVIIALWVKSGGNKYEIVSVIDK